ncbi:iron complex outermembrane recepter protein [Ekhidna lutea]|uniref:Iron complex outermembrane recepter protein n=1 Tax=Ekhidna lutea TaxID=447679 RepID=A0A239H176_EKHLU|nr:TonB-dependent receptor [Ekhidna lutea]SNS74921.1 iron complex outermembrane recepter protein [Ekhidna lutea]
MKRLLQITMSRIRIVLLSILGLSSFLAASQSKTISGKIVDSESGEVIIGATVVIQGTTTGDVTGVDGIYTLNAKAGDRIEVSYVGYERQVFEVLASQSTYDLSLAPSAEQLSEIVVVGSRNQNRTVIDSPVPIDVIDVADVAATNGKVEINQILQYAAPSFNATKQSGSDGADHIDPASLRGLGPDQTLVLINGKRRHQSSLVNVFGTRGRGNSGTDLNAIPASAIKRIEILRDGASAQYGSDAIAGVINIVLRNDEGVSGGVTYGAYSTAIGEGWEEETGETLFNVEGKNRLDGKNKSFDGNTYKMDFNYGLPIGEKGGFANITTEFLSKDRTLRPGFSWRKGYGTAAVDGFNFMINSEVPISEQTSFYAFGGRSFRHTDAHAFSRDSFANGDNRSVPSLHPNGFTPHITSDINDVSASAGFRHTMDNGWNVDFSNTYGKNNFHYYIVETNNASLKAASPTDFDAGGHNLSQNVTNLDFNKFYKDIAAGFNLAYGMEYRTERFTIFAGEEGSYALYDNNGVAIRNPADQSPATDTNGDDLPGGSQGFPGYSPDNVVDRGRTNLGLYLDSEINLSDDFLIGGALRFEKYSDFGETFNFKLASRYSINESLSLRGSVSSGFRAPSLAQIHYNLIFNNIVAGASVPSLLSANTSTVTKAFGIGPLQEETAINTSIGFTYNSGGFNMTVDAYSISVDDRIVLTDNFDASGLGLGVDAAQFFANGVDTNTKGVDIVVGYKYELASNSNLDVSVSGNFNKLKIDKIKNGNLNEFTFFGPFSQAYLKAAAPDHKLGARVSYTLNKFSANLFVTQFSEVILQDFQWVDSPATTQAEADALFPVATDVYEAATTVDLSLSYSFTDSFRFTLGGNNIFNTYPTPQFDAWTDQGGLSDSVQMGSDGAYFFGRIGFNF